MIKEARLQVKLSPQLKKKLVSHAKAVDLSASQIVRMAVSEFLRARGVKV